MTCYSPLKGFEDKENGGIVFKRGTNAGGPMEVACGQCIGCRIDKSKEWAARIVHEQQMHEENCFITLTYDKENLPHDGSLNKTHFQKFMKRLRKHFNEKKIRYFHCGEYGEKNYRPHYHACIFGVDFHDRIPYSVSNNIVVFESELLAQIWGNGFCTVGELNYQSAAYTARYVLKKVNGSMADQHYERCDVHTGEIFKVEPEYITMSLGREKGEGIGGPFYKKYETDFFPSDECPVPGRGVYKRIPRYYERLYEETNPDAYRKIKRARELYRENNKEEYERERLEAKLHVKKRQLKELTRSL